MLRQTVRPARIVLVLSRNEFHTEALPERITEQCERGLEILWVNENMKSYNKLIPVATACGTEDILTIDDDIFYSAHLVDCLLKAKSARPNTIIGMRGWEVGIAEGELLPYRLWKPASRRTRPNLVMLTGVGGVLYPAGDYRTGQLVDYKQASTLCPTADDVWFWANTLTANVESYCLGINSLHELRSQLTTPRLVQTNVALGGNDRQIENMVKAFPALPKKLGLRLN